MEPPVGEPTPEVESRAITALPVSLQPVRKPIRKRSAHYQPLRRRRSAVSGQAAGLHASLQDSNSRQEAGPSTAKNQTQEDADDADDAVIASISDLSDTHVAALTLRSQWPQEATNQLPNTPPIILRSQLYALVADSTAVDQQLNSLVFSGTLRHILVPSTKSQVSRDAYIFTDNITSHPAYDSPIFHTFFKEVFPHCPHPIVEEYIMSAAYDNKHANAIDQLIRAGLLTHTHERSYSFAIPGMGLIKRNRAEGATQIQRILKKAPYCEMALPTLEQRTLKKTMFTAQWHVRDMVGSGMLKSVATTVGTIIRLAPSHL